MVMTHQIKDFYSAGVQLMRQGGWSYLYTGMLATMLCEGMFSTFFLGVTPVLKNRIKEYYANDYFASLLAGMTAGVGATLASQGFDVVKTTQQSAVAKTPMGFFKAAQKLYSENGVNGFFKGTIPRGSRVIAAVTIMGWVNETMTEMFSTSQEEKETESFSTKKGLK